MRYRIKSPEIEAFRYGVDETPDWFLTVINAQWAMPYSEGVSIRTTYNQIEYILKGDWILRGYNGIPHGIHADDFERLYEPCE